MQGRRTKPRNLARLIRDDRGQGLVEFALVIPAVLFILFAVVQFGLLYTKYVTLSDATRVGARTAAVSRSTCPGNTETAVRNSAGGINPLTVVITPCPWTAGGQVTVTAETPWSLDLLGFVVASGTLSSSTTNRVE